MNSILSLNKYSSQYKISIINLFGEWEKYRIILNEIEYIDFFLSKFFPFKKKITGFIKSRLVYIFVGITSVFELYSLLRKKKPDFLIVHLLTYIPLLLLIFFKFETQFILRISGFPKLNFMRKFLWKLASKKIYKIFCPTLETMEILKKEKIFDEKKIYFLEDPIIQISEISKKMKEKIDTKFQNKKFIFAIGRLTKQKNFKLLIQFFKEISKNDDELNLLIAGEGESKKDLENLIFKNSLQHRIKLLGFEKNVFKFLKHCQCFISTSLWEDPGFVILEAAVTNTIIISSNCSSGPKEILMHGKGGYLFENNNLKSLIETYKQFIDSSEKDIFLKRKNVKRKSKNYTFFSHYKKMNHFLNN